MNEAAGLCLIVVGIVVLLWFAHHFMEWAMDDNTFFDGGDITDKELNDERRTDEQ